MTIMGIAAILNIDLDHHMLKGIILSYEKFPLGVFQTKYEDFSEMIIRVTQDSFNIGIQLSEPFLLRVCFSMLHRAFWPG
jgi:flagellar biosynthesis protein FliR